jgi:dihydroxy-acid dehydratase
MPGMMMAIARLNLPAVFVYNGSTLPGYLNGKALDITSVFEASARARRAPSPRTS